MGNQNLNEELVELSKMIVSATQGDVTVMGDIFEWVHEKNASFHDKMLCIKLRKFINDVYVSDTDKIKICNKLFSNDNENKSKQNALRLIDYIDKTNTEYVLQFVINAARSIALYDIDEGTFFRIVKAITESLYEDLIYLSDDEVQKGLIQIILYNIVRNRIKIAHIKKGVNL